MDLEKNLTTDDFYQWASTQKHNLKHGAAHILSWLWMQNLS